jgi:hypothetical protein
MDPLPPKPFQLSISRAIRLELEAVDRLDADRPASLPVLDLLSVDLA